MQVTKEKVIEAIITEPLAPNRFVQESEGSPSNTEPCAVCAVGAVLRSCGWRDRSMWDIDHVAERIIGVSNASFLGNQDEVEELVTVKDYLDEGLYLPALSVKFESLCSRLLGDFMNIYVNGKYQTLDADQGMQVRCALAAFVNESFPNVIEVPSATE